MAFKLREECNQSRLQNLTRGWFLLILIRMWVCKRLFPQVDLGQPPVRPISTDRTPLDPLPLGGLPHQCVQTLETRTRTGEVSVQKIQSRTFPRNPLLQASRTGQTLEANLQVSLFKIDLHQQYCCSSEMYMYCFNQVTLKFPVQLTLKLIRMKLSKQYYQYFITMFIRNWCIKSIYKQQQIKNNKALKN